MGELVGFSGSSDSLESSEGRDGPPVKPWPSWGPANPSSKLCLVCGGDVCSCGYKIRSLVAKAEAEDPVAKHMMYFDPLLNRKVPWLRVVDAVPDAVPGAGRPARIGAQKLPCLQCWLCHNFLFKKANPAAKLCHGVLGVGASRVGQLKDHVRQGEGGDHGKAEKNYIRQCKRWIADEWGETVRTQSIEEAFADWSKCVDERRLNHMFYVYLCIYQRESKHEYEVHCEAAKRTGSNLYGALYANASWFEKAQKALSCRMFEVVWNRLAQSPVVVPCTDEAERHLGIRVQYLDVTDQHIRPAQDFLQLRFLDDFSAKGIWSSVLRAFTDASARPDAIKHLVFTEAQFASKLVAFVADGASVNGLTTNQRTGARSPIVVAREGENVFYLMSEFKKVHNLVPLLGVWCSPHRIDLVADALTDEEVLLPTLHLIGEFVEALCQHVKASGKAQADLSMLNSLMEAEYMRVGCMHISGKAWISNVEPIKEICKCKGMIWMHLMEMIRHPTTASQRENGQKLKKILESPMFHFVLPAYADIQTRLKILNAVLEKDSVSLHDVRESTDRFNKFLHSYALRTRHEGAENGTEGTPSLVTRVARDWANGDMENPLRAQASFFEKGLSQMKLVNVKKPVPKAKAQIVKTLRYSAPLRDGSTVDIDMAWHDDMLMKSVTEIRAVTRMAGEQIAVRFPASEILDDLFVFAPDFAPQKMDTTILHQHLTTLAKHWCVDPGEYISEFDELMAAVKRGRDKHGPTMVEVWDEVLTQLRREGRELKILEPVYLYLCISAQNASLERCFAKHRMMKDRLKGGWGADSQDERLRIQCCGKPPLDMMFCGQDGNTYDTLLLKAAFDTVPKVRAPGGHRQKSLHEMQQQGEIPKRKVRDDEGKTRKTRCLKPSPLHDALTEEVARGKRHAGLEAIAVEMPEDDNAASITPCGSMGLSLDDLDA